MTVAKVVTAQRDFSAGELNPEMKRSDDQPVMKAGARQMRNWRQLNSKGFANRPGRRVMFLDGPRVDEVLMSPGNTFYLVFGAGTLKVYDASYTLRFSDSTQTWTALTARNVVWDVYRNSVYIFFASRRPQILTWDGTGPTGAWALSNYTEDQQSSGQKRTAFYRLSPLGITLQPSAPVGGGFVQALNILNAGIFTQVPTVTIGPPAAGGVTATATATLNVSAVTAVVNGGAYGTINPIGAFVILPNGVVLQVTSSILTGGGFYTIVGAVVISRGSLSVGSTPANPVTATGMSGGNPFFIAPTFNLTWQLGSLTLTNSGGSNYTSTPSVTLSPAGGALVTATISAINVNLTTTLTFSAGMKLTNSYVGTRIRFCNRQILITGVTSPTVATGLIEESLFPGMQIGQLADTIDLSQFFAIGDEVIGQTSGAKGIVVSFANGLAVRSRANIQLLGGTQFTGEIVVGSGGGIRIDAIIASNLAPFAVTVWDEEVMNDFRGYPASGFVDQGRLGLCDFPALPNLIVWSFQGNFTDIYTDENNVSPVNAIQELAPGKSQVRYVIPGSEGSEFVFCDNAVYYIPINQTTPLQPGSVAFNTLIADGCAPVKPQRAQQSIVFVSASDQQLKTVQPIGAYNRPNIVDDITELHSHLINGPVAIAIPGGSLQFEERYIYVLNSDGTMMVGKYGLANGLIDVKTIGWLPWSGNGTPTWVSARPSAPVVLIGGTYAPGGISAVTLVEQIDNSQFLDATMLYNNAPSSLTPPGGKGPLWWIAGGQVDLMDGARMMGTYVVDANGFLVPQNNAGEDFTSTSLTAGQAWTATFEPFVPAVQPGQDVNQRMRKRRIQRHEIYVKDSSGFTMVRFFAGPITRTSPAVGTVMKVRRFPAWNQDDDPTQPPPLREQSYQDRPAGRVHDPRVGIIKDTPGSLTVLEVDLEVSV